MHLAYRDRDRQSRAGERECCGVLTRAGRAAGAGADRGSVELARGLLEALLPVGCHRLLVVVALKVLLPAEVVAQRLEPRERLELELLLGLQRETRI
jgi:hypothetical protein